ncbi:hypothetical protein [Rhodoplanes serenus]|uniref:hypothetical protein n=1 Tax=Rhodoplanes serenus TaxID=200615 RepID=UPI000DAF27A5|nr:hypothetical protein [Rhodoplanes serenus]RAI30366.1 hypothetical protein CH340_21735 [Rhodoplanes serenus]
MATEAQIEAACAAYAEKIGWRWDEMVVHRPSYADQILIAVRAAIDAAEAAAWSDNMSDAPMDRRILVEIDGAGVLAWTGDDCWPDGAQRWREIPAPPVTR